MIQIVDTQHSCANSGKVEHALSHEGSSTPASPGNCIPLGLEPLDVCVNLRH